MGATATGPSVLSGARPGKQKSSELALWKGVFEHINPEQIRGPHWGAGAQKSLTNICFASQQSLPALKA